MIENQFSKEERLYIYEESRWKTLYEIKDMNQELKKNIKIVYGHFLFGIHKYFDQPTKYMTIIREPVDRILSAYYHFKTIPARRKIMLKLFNLGANLSKNLPKSLQRRHSNQLKDHYFISSHNLSVMDFVKCGRFGVDNTMVRRISNIPAEYGKITRKIYETAIYNIENYFMDVLLMEDMKQSVQRLSAIIGSTDLSIRMDNVNKKRERTELDANTLSFLKETNKYDLMLYDYCRQRFKR
jgi:hypothetical protein